MTQPLEVTADVTYTNALIDGRIGSLSVSGSKIAAVDEGPRRGDRIVDLHGDRLLPGLINAHDHLQLNSLPALSVDHRYRHVKEWIADINRRRQSDPEFEAHVMVARDARLVVGGIKNLLSGVTTVAHHDPLYPTLQNSAFPVAVVTNYGWSHSVYIDSVSRVSEAYRATPSDWPWIIHAAEGVDEEAAAEFERLDRLGCIQSNTVLVHGVALDRTQQQRLRRALAALIWCPRSNVSLFGKSADVDYLIRYGCVALGTDSRLSGSRDLLEELSVARQQCAFDDATLESLVTRRAARILRLTDRGALRVGMRADLLIIPAGARLSNTTRADVRLVMVNGEVRYGDAEYALAHGPETCWSPIQIDGSQKMLARHIVAAMFRLNAVENGMTMPDRVERAA